MSFFDFADSVNEAFYFYLSRSLRVVPLLFVISVVFLFIFRIVKFIFKSIKKKKNVRGE